ncbi:hypothetical protein [Clostridium sp. DJ247]|uniref:hypothetical protein n=1 Tax=Clostridium sp. DJ247 TaxID=2726188 RepID=UPI0016245DE7|nr:hypothetical protein [Clostridium sp. DJ247]MBC2581542.1 hypothetical protein [Clostridium sp. DJ247]
MLKNLANKITYYIETNSDIKSTDDLEKINYSLQAILNETFKIVVLTLKEHIIYKV